MLLDMVTGKYLTFDEVFPRCRYFFRGSDVNSGYGCTHPQQEEVEDGLGRCYDFTCPLGLFEDDPEWGPDSAQQTLERGRG